MKTKQQTGIWVFAAIVLAIIVAAAAYFTLIGPELDNASAARQEAQIARDANDLTELEIEKMKALEQEVPDWREQIAKVSLDLPPRVEQPALERLVAARLEAADLPVVSVTTSRPAVIDALAMVGSEPPTVASAAEAEESTATEEPAPAASAEDEVDTDGTTGGVAGDTTDTAAAAPVAPFTGLLQMQVGITTEGDPGDVLDFLKSMEKQLTRFYTVTGFTIQKADQVEESPGRPELTEEKWTVQITGMVFSLLDDTRSFVADEDNELREYKAGSRVANAFEPLAGTEEGSA
ncbi:hypothetical protein [Demequina maris]|uniref:hypothetical protein n=1 Tax=Demequina maris TaxID=1638982 RepID=UPI000782EAE5|nr:hypothetical protein [Demequina maris]